MEEEIKIRSVEQGMAAVRAARKKLEEEFDLSEWITEDGEGYGPDISVVRATKVKEFIRRSEAENNDLEEDIIGVLELGISPKNNLNSGKKDLMKKMRRLCRAHKQERDKLAGSKLTGKPVNLGRS